MLTFNRTLAGMLSLLLLTSTPALARPGRNGRAALVVPPQEQQAFWQQESLGRASRDIGRAERSRIRIGLLARQVASPEANTLVELGEQLLASAQAQFQAQNGFAARETAKAADNLFKAAQILYEAELGYGSESRRHWEAPLRAQEYLARASAANPSGTAATLVAQSNQLLNRAQGSAANLAYGRAARHTARATLHLLVAERGF